MKYITNHKSNTSMKYIVMEEIGTKYVNSSNINILSDFVKKTRSDDDHPCPLDESVIKYIVKVHIIEIKEEDQFIIYPNLQHNVHYSISNNDIMREIVKKASRKRIGITYYKKDRDHLDAHNKNIIILNNIKDEDIILDEEKKEISKVLDNNHKITRHNTTGFNIGVSGRNAKGWTQPHPDLNMYATNGVLNKEGYACNIPIEIKHSIANVLNFMGSRMKIILSSQSIRVYDDKYRQSLFSDNMRSLFNVTYPIYFEGCCVHTNKGGLPPHIDHLNCREEGYNYTAVYAFHCNMKRYTVIGYSRRAVYNYIQRLDEAKRLMLKCKT